MERTYPKPLSLVRHFARKAAEAVGFTVEQESPMMIQARSGASFFSWGDRMTIRLSERDGATVVSVESAASHQLFDWNKGASDQQQILDYLDRALKTEDRRATGPVDKMAKTHRIFISFAKEDIRYRDLLVGQAKHERTPFDFVDMSVKEPWDAQWKTNCRTKIKGCDGMIALISSNTMKADGARWEVGCANEEGVPVIGMYVSQNDRGALPPELKGKAVIDWTWDGIAQWLKKL